MIDQQTVDKVFDTVQILDVVSEFVSLKRRGQNYIGLCPFHNDRTPSFYVSPSKNICKCFSCGKGGNAVHFLMEHEQMTFFEAIRWLAAKYNIEIQERRLSDEELQAQTKREGMLLVNEYARDTFVKQLFENPEGRNIGLTYFYERGFRDDLIRKFQLGYTMDQRSAFADQATKHGFNRDVLTATGLCYERDNDHVLVDRFRARVMFPIHSLSGKVVAFGGRVLDARTKGVNQKYVNSPESEIYHKASILYGIYQAKSAIAKAQCCYLVEGYTDVLSMHQAGIENVVASSGTALTQGQIRMIQRFTPNITVLYDGDAAGIHAALRGIDLILKEGMNVKVLLLPDEEDPDSFARKHTSQEFLDYIAQNETDFLRFKANILMRDAGTDPLKRASMIAEIVRTLAIIPDPIVVSVYLREMSHMLEIGESVLVNAVNIQKANNFEAERKQEEVARRRELTRLKGQQTPSEEGASAPASEAASAADSPADAPKPEPALSSAEHYVAETQQGEISPDVELAIHQMVNREQDQKKRDGERRALPTDRYERSLIRYIVRDGGKSFVLTGQDEAGNPVEETWRVIDFIGNELTCENLELQHPLYSKMYHLALDASEDPQQPFDSVRFFSTYPDEQVSMTATDMLADKYATFGIPEADDQLSALIPRAVLELKCAIIRGEIATLQEQLKDPTANITQVMAELNQKNEIRKLLEKDLGERIISF
jgi:DNA primase